MKHRVVKLAVIGLGNSLMGDDGIGPRVIRELRNQPEGFLPPNVELLEGGGCIAHYWDLLQRATHLVVVDAVQGGDAAGTIYLWQDARQRPIVTDCIKHEDDFFSAWQLAAWRGISPQVVLVGIEPETMGFAEELSPAVSRRLFAVMDCVREQCLLIIRP